MDITFKISVPCDDDGFLTLTCPACQGDFKLLGDQYQNQDIVDLFCPYCGLSDVPNSFLGKDVMEAAYREAENQAMALVEKELGKMMKSLNQSKFIKAETKSRFKNNSPKELFEENNMKKILLSCCGKEVKISDGSSESIIYCPFCGVNK
jgi:hypothetical protein